MKKFLAISSSLILALSLSVACGDSDNEGTDAGNQEDAATEDAGTEEDGGTGGDVEQGIGSSCTCEGEDCEQMTVPQPASGTIVDCDDVPTDWTGAELVCMRSYPGGLATATYFANGYCGLMATACEGASFICDSATFGDYAGMTTCPTDTVMISDSQTIEVMGESATIDSKMCMLGCEVEGDCRAGENDPVLEEPSQYTCIDKDGVKFCCDPRGLTDGYTAQAF